MQVTSHSLNLASSSHYRRSEHEKLSLHLAPPPTMQAGEIGAGSGEEDLEGIDPKLRMMVLMLEALTGQKIKVENFRSGSMPGLPSSAPAQSNSPILEYQYQMEEHSRMGFSVEGNVVLEDGSRRVFSLSIEWAQSFAESFRLRIQDGKILTDPLVISLDGSQPLSTNAFAFNLTGRENQTLPYIAGNAGYLALDGDGDGKITRGSELFGPRSGEGFMELAAYDGDQNGWIDSGDEVFRQLRIWMITETDENLLTLKEAGIGAISLTSAPLDYTLKSDASTAVAHYKKGSVALGEKEEVYGVFEVDVAG